jgi:hypothetical protein
MVKKFLNWIRKKLAARKRKAEFDKAYKEYKKKDPFTYKNF